jgi:hypothetical protein
LEVAENRPRRLLVCRWPGRTHRDAAGTFAAMSPFWSMPALDLCAAVPAGIALISTLAGVGSLISSPVIAGRLNEHTQTRAAGQHYMAALMIVGAVTIVAIEDHNRNCAGAVPQLKVAAKIQ